MNRTDYLRHHYHSTFFVSNVTLSANCHFLSANFFLLSHKYHFFIFISLFNKYIFVFCFVIPYYQRNFNQNSKNRHFTLQNLHFSYLITLILFRFRYTARICESFSSVILSPSLRACLIAEVRKPLLCILLKITSASIATSYHIYCHNSIGMSFFVTFLSKIVTFTCIYI